MLELILAATMQAAPPTNVGLHPASAPVFVRSADDLNTRCPSRFRDAPAEQGKFLAPQHCEIAESGEIGTVDGDTYFYGLYCVKFDIEFQLPCREGARPTSNLHGSGALFVRRRGEQVLRILDAVTFYGILKFGKPEFARTPNGVILQQSMIATGSCDCNESAYYLWRPRESRWVALDFEDWQSTLRARLPAGITNRDTPWPDLRTLTVRGALWTGSDAHCCPTAGEFVAGLAVKGNRLALASLRVFDRPPPKP